MAEKVKDWDEHLYDSKTTSCGSSSSGNTPQEDDISEVTLKIHMKSRANRTGKKLNKRTKSHKLGQVRRESLVHSQGAKKEKKIAGKTLTLHNLIMARRWDEIVNRCEQHPHEAKRWTETKSSKSGTIIFRKLPIHTALWYNAPEKCIHALLQAYPDSVKKPDEFGRLPLHCAVSKLTSLDTVDSIIEMYPVGLTMADSKGMLPLHRAKATGAKREIFNYLFDAYPAAISKPDVHGRLPNDYITKLGSTTLIPSDKSCLAVSDKLESFLIVE